MRLSVFLFLKEFWGCLRSDNEPEFFAQEDLRELYLAFVEPGAIGLSSIGSLLQPKGRQLAECLKILMNASSSNGKCIEAQLHRDLLPR